MALSCAVKPDRRTIAPFAGKLQGRIEITFSEILWSATKRGFWPADSELLTHYGNGVRWLEKCWPDGVC